MTTIQSLIDAFNNLASVLEFMGGAFIIISMLALALWRRDMILYFVAGLVTFFIGITWASDYTGVSYAMLFLAAYELLSGLRMVLESAAPSRGWSQFKNIYDRVKEWF